MSAELVAISLLNERFLTDYPFEAARALETVSTDAAVAVLQSHSPTARLHAWRALAPDRAGDVLVALPPEIAQYLLVESDVQVGVAALSHVKAARRESLLAALPEETAADLRALMQHAPGTAGHLMDPRIGAVSAQLTVAEAIERLRDLRQHGLRELFVVDEQMRLLGQIEVEDLALTGRERPIREIMRAVSVTVRDKDSATSVAKRWQEQPLSVVPVLSESGRFVGVIRQSQLVVTARSSRGWLQRWFG
jgi:magnesium transporter